MKVLDKFQASFIRNPAAWVLFGLLCFSVYSHYETGRKLTRVCELAGPFDYSTGNPRTDRERMANICLSRQGDD